MSKIRSAPRHNILLAALHWTMAVALVVQVLLIFARQFLAESGFDLPFTEYRIVNLHKSIGVVIFFTAALRLLWRLIGGLAPWPHDMPEWEQILTHKVEIALYTFMFATPLSGVLTSVVSGYPVLVFGRSFLPSYWTGSESLLAFTLIAHAIVVWTFYATIMLHVTLVFRRRKYDDPRHLRRMSLS